MKLKDKVVVVTGASSGIGKAIAELFLKEGAKVVVSDINDMNPDLICENCFYIKTDVSDSEQVDSLLDQTVKRHGKVDIMVNNAGIGTTGSVTDMTDEIWNRTIAVNLSGVFFGTRAAAKTMSDKNIHGSIINISSILGRVGFPGAIAYCAAKGGVEQLTRASAVDLAPNSIRVNAIAPGFIETPMTKDYLKNQEFKSMIEAGTPLARVGRPEEIAKSALFLASGDSSYITGNILFADGGWTAR